MSSELINPEKVISDIKNSIPKEVTTTAKQIAGATSQIMGTAHQAASIVGDQMNNLSNAVGTKEMISEMSQELIPMKDFLLHILKVAFFIEKEERITRGEYIIGSLAVTIIIGLTTGIIAIALGKLGVILGFLFMTVPLFNLAIKRFHDLNKPGRWSAMTLIPFFGIIMPALFKGTEGVNPYGPDPLSHTPKDNKDYIIAILSLFILSSIITSILSFVGLRSTQPKIDPSDPTMMGDKNIVGSKTNEFKDQGATTAQKTVNNAKNTSKNAVTNTKNATNTSL